MNCTHCNKTVTLTPSATERAKKFGGKPSDYTKLFPAHGECTIRFREAETVKLIRKIVLAA